SPHLDLGTPLVDVPRLVVLVVELEAQRLPRADEEELADVGLRLSPQELPAPRLFDPLRLEGERVETAQIRRTQLPLVHGATLSHAGVAASHCGSAAICSSARRRSFGVFTVSHRPSCRKARRRPSATISGKVVVSWSPRSGSRSSASSPKT